MNLYTLKTILYLLLLFSSNVVYCDATQGDISCNARPISTNNKINTKKLKIKNGIITTNFLYIESCQIKPPTRRFVYKLSESTQNTLLHPNRLDAIRFFDFIMEFDENAKLPNANVEYISIFTCQHYNPLILYMYGDSKFYYYSLDPNTNKWNNHKIRYDTRFTENIDENGINYYILSTNNTDFSNYKFEDKELVNELCNINKCGYVYITDNDNIEIYVYKPKIYIIGCSHIDSFQIQPLTKRFVHKVNESLQGKLAHPNIMYGIRFYNYLIPFDNNAKLPSINAEYISIYTCEYNNPVLISIYGNSRYYYYSLDPNTNKWNNHILKYDTRLKKNTDKNGVVYYTISKLKNCIRSLFRCCQKGKNEIVNIVQEHCADGRCVSIDMTYYMDLLFYVIPADFD